MYKIVLAQWYPENQINTVFDENKVLNLLSVIINDHQMSRVLRKTDFWPWENKGADQQLCSNCPADLCLCFRFMDSMIPFLPKSLVLFCDCTDWLVSDLF